jgi:hypothetical protein
MYMLDVCEPRYVEQAHVPLLRYTTTHSLFLPTGDPSLVCAVHYCNCSTSRFIGP